MLLRAIMTRLLNRHFARRLTRLIPHPGLRAAAALATSIIIPFVVERVLTRATTRREWRHPFSHRVRAS